MATNDTGVTIHPYFEIHDGKVDEFKAICGTFISLTKNEEKCHYYGFSFDGNNAHCREGYADADGLLKHLENVDAPLKQALGISNLSRLEIHGPEAELAKLREPLAALNPQFYVLEYGFRN
ncbi:MAG: hypothetical protein OER96_02445 [Gammaproteobacteria bacterium]|nr:hypothetical protein [Gammaproteobacteria bacterium]